MCSLRMDFVAQHQKRFVALQPPDLPSLGSRLSTVDPC